MPSLILKNSLKKLIFLMPALFLFWPQGANACTIVIAVWFLVHSGKTKNWTWAKKPWMIAALSLWVYAIAISSPLAVYPAVSLEILSRSFHYIIFGAALAYWILQDKTARKWFELGVIAVVVFIIVDCFYQAHFGKDLFGFTKGSNRLTGPFGEYNFVPGIYVTKLIFIALASIFCATKFKSLLTRTTLLLSSMVFVLVCVFLTGERAALLNFLLGCAIVLTGLFALYPRIRFLLLSGCVTMIISIGTACFLNPTMYERSITSTRETIADWPNSAYGKIARSAIDIWKNTPETNIFTGVGLENYSVIINDEDNKHIKEEIDWGKNSKTGEFFPISHSHNFYIEWLAGAGIIGLIGFITMVLLLLKDLIWHNIYSTKFSLSLFATAVFMTSFWPLTFNMNYFGSKHAVIVWMTVGWALAVTMKKKNKNTS
ncbi:MAG: O-antigen ligase family protein [Phycisphaerae bacterium]|jgi:O-antigen ligase|nr:O-antigen ligase family protein [Phycisphaerae bacterium]